MGAVEEVGVLEQVGLVGEDLLDAERPLLIPGMGKAEGLVPGWQLDGPGSGASRQRHPERFEDDAGHVVFRLLLREAEGVDLHAVAETTQPRVGDAPSFRAIRSHMAVKARILQVSSTKRMPALQKKDAPDDRRQFFRRQLTGVPDGVDHADGRRQGECQFLHRCGSRLLQVVTAHVDGVPPGGMPDGPGHRVDDETPARGGRENVGASGEVLLDDVVLGGAGEEAALTPVVSAWAT